MDTFLWILEDLFLIAGAVLVILGLYRMIKRKPKGILFIISGIILILIFLYMADLESLKAAFERGQNAAGN